ncbi:transposase [Streptomyces altiplanensis]
MRERFPLRPKKRGVVTDPSPVGRRKAGSKHHLICHGPGTPLKAITTAASVNDGTQPLALVDGIPPIAIADRSGSPPPTPRSLARRLEHRHRPGGTPQGPHPLCHLRKGAPNIQRMGKLRCVVEQTFAPPHEFKRLAVRRERQTALHAALILLTCSLIRRRRHKKGRP